MALALGRYRRVRLIPEFYTSRSGQRKQRYRRQRLRRLRQLGPDVGRLIRSYLP